MNNSVTPTFVIKPERKWELPNLSELLSYREMIYLLTWRDVKASYRQSGLGMLWVLIKPFAQMVAFSILFGKVAKLTSNGLPYPIFNFSALVPWFFFSSGLSSAVHSMVGGAGLFSRVRFPRLVLPIAGLLSGGLDFLIQLAVLCAMMLYYGIFPGWNIIWLPFYVILLLMTSLGTGLLLGTFNVKYRDVKQSMGLLLQIWMFATPVVYSSSIVPGKWRYVYALNPMTAVIKGFRWTLLRAADPPDGTLLVSIASSVVILLVGLFYFQRNNKSFVDYLVA